MPAELLRPRIGTFDSHTVTVGLKANLPREWIGQVDYVWSRNKNVHTYQVPDNNAVNADLSSGVINPFLDTQLYPVDLSRYATATALAHGASQNNVSARASGPLPKLPWGTPRLTFSVENRVMGTVDGTSESTGIQFAPAVSRTYYLGLKQAAASAYAEVQLPLIERGRRPFLHALELQLAGRRDRFTLATGTPTATLNLTTGAKTFGVPTRAGAAFRSEATFDTTNPTVALKYQPLPEVTVRASYATAFQPPTAAQLQRNPEPNVAPTLILDPRTNTSYNVSTISGGNPNVQPQNSKSWNGGVIWEPRAPALRGLRLNAEYYFIEQFDAISTLTAQVLVNQFPDRVTRDAAGLITLVDTSSINLYGRQMEGWDFTASYQFKLGEAGSFSLRGTRSIVLTSKTKFSLTLPAYDGVNYPLDTSIGGAMRHRSNFNLNWERGLWSAGWTSRLISSYRAYGAAGGPLSLQSAAGADFSTYAKAQRNNGTIPSQDFHDVVVGYKFAGKGAARLADRLTTGLSVTVGVRNVFNSEPAYDVGPFGLGYLSPFGDVRMREYWINVRKTF
jgi:outer membrane receptor protein involved in Fe transport